MKFKNLMYGCFVALLILAACGDSKKEEAEKKAAEQLEIEKEKIAEALKKSEDSLKQVQIDSIRRDSITKDSLRQVKEHGHAH